LQCLAGKEQKRKEKKRKEKKRKEKKRKEKKRKEKKRKEKKKKKKKRKKKKRKEKKRKGQCLAGINSSCALRHMCLLYNSLPLVHALQVCWINEKIADLGRGPAHVTILTPPPPPSSALPIVLRLSTVGSHPLLPFSCHVCLTLMPIITQAFDACLHVHQLLLNSPVLRTLFHVTCATSCPSPAFEQH